GESAISMEKYAIVRLQILKSTEGASLRLMRGRDPLQRSEMVALRTESAGRNPCESIRSTFPARAGSLSKGTSFTDGTMVTSAGAERVLTGASEGIRAAFS
ncbi:MAG TPA: hypothetical protein VF214_02805, partial [Edaphobacter sp.]